MSTPVNNLGTFNTGGLPPFLQSVFANTQLPQTNPNQQAAQFLAQTNGFGNTGTSLSEILDLSFLMPALARQNNPALMGAISGSGVGFNFNQIISFMSTLMQQFAQSGATLPNGAQQPVNQGASEQQPVEAQVAQPTIDGEKAAGEDLPNGQTTAGSVTVQSGDTLSKIAAANGTTVDALYELNKAIIGDDKNLIKPGQKLQLP